MKPLENVRVVDLSRLLPGPMCSWYLVGMGASVTKVESPDGGDYLRFAPPLQADGESAWFAAINAGKKSVALNLKVEVHRDALRALLSDADVLIESFRPGVMARLGLDPEALMKEFPRLVICSITGFGQTGPLRGLPGHDLGYQAVSGALSLGLRRAGVPGVPGMLVSDLAGGALTASMRICAALFERERTGLGGWLDVSMTEGTLAMMAPLVASMDASGENPAPGGELLSGGAAQYRVYVCRDGRSLAVAPLEPKFWATFHAAVSGEVGESVEQDSVQLAKVFAMRDRDEWARLLDLACCSPVLELDELVDFPQHRVREAVSRKNGTIRVSHPLPGGAGTAHLVSPGLGEHTAESLHRVGFNPDRLENS
jgi:alpha-methylacyl-CoA racemase